MDIDKFKPYVPIINQKLTLMMSRCLPDCYVESDLKSIISNTRITRNKIFLSL